MNKHLIFAILLTTVFVTGCSNGNVPLKGKVTFSDDDSPLTVGTICFENNTTMARGDLNSDGKFVVGSLRMNDGLPPGTYRVYFTNVIAPMNTNASGRAGGFEPLVAPKYLRSTTSGLEIDVTPTTKDYSITVERNPKLNP